MRAVAKKVELEPLIINRSADREGATYALDHDSRERLLRELASEVHIAPRVFIAHETKADFDKVRGGLMPQIASILTGLSEDQLSALGPVVFVDPVTEKELASWRPGHR